MNRSLRSALLGGITCTTALVFTGVALVLYWLIQQSLWTEFDSLLAAKARALAALVKQDGERIRITFEEHPLQEFARQSRPEYYQVWSDDGGVLARSRRLGARDLERPSGSLVRPGFRSAILPDGRSGRLAAMRFPADPVNIEIDHPLRRPDSGPDDDDLFEDRAHSATRSFVTLVVARETSEVDAALRRAGWTLAGVFSAAILLLHVMLSRIVTSRLNPLDRLAGEINAMSVRSLSARLSIVDAPAELQPVVQRFNELMDRLQIAFARERTFSSDVAHELRTPLTGLRTILDVALSRPRSGEQYQKSIQECHAICDQTQRIVETLLTMGRLESGQMAMDREIVDVAMMLEHTWSPFQAQAALRRVEVKWDVESGVLLNTDAAQFRILLANLFDNAASYVDEEGAIRILGRADLHGLQIVVENTGCVLSREQAAQVFERFWRVDACRGETGTHAGLGLALCRRIVTLLQGSIDATVDDGRFAVIIRFPRALLEAHPIESDSDAWAEENDGDAAESTERSGASAAKREFLRDSAQEVHAGTVSGLQRGPEHVA